MENPEKFYTRSQLAEILAVHPSTVTRMMDDGVWPTVPVRGDRRVRSTAFWSWIESAETQSQDQAAARTAATAPARRPVGRPRKASLNTRPAAIAAASA